MACGTPVIVSNVSSLPEVVSDAGLYFNPSSEAALEQIVDDVELRRQLVRKGMDRSKPVFNTPSDPIRPLQYWIFFFGCNHFLLKNGDFGLRKGLKPSIQSC